MKGLFGSAIGHTHGAAPQFPQSAVLSPRDLEVIKQCRSFRRNGLLTLIQPGAKQTGKAGPPRSQGFSADRTDRSRRWVHCDARVTVLSEFATARAVLRPPLTRCLRCVALRPEASRDNAPATG